ncbi:MAG: transketolase family protein, partial [Ruminococcus sp.]|nr:transketolase family protein [Ruminococcus sp.]
LVGSEMCLRYSGKGVVMKDGSDITIIATGLMVNEALEASKVLETEGISARVVNIHTIKPLDKELICRCAKETGVIVTAEEHSVIGGLGSAVAEAVTECCPVPVVKIGVNDVYGYSGPAVDLLKDFGLSAENIVKTTKEALKLK